MRWERMVRWGSEIRAEGLRAGERIMALVRNRMVRAWERMARAWERMAHAKERCVRGRDGWVCKVERTLLAVTAWCGQGRNGARARERKAR